MRAGSGQRRARHPDHHRVALSRADRRPGDEHRRRRRLPRDRRRRGPQPVAATGASGVPSAEMVELTFIRHADAGDPLAWQGDDEVRPLSPKGERQADRLGRFLAGVGFAPDAIVTSPKLRALQTAQIVAERIGKPFSIDTRLARAIEPGHARDAAARRRRPGATRHRRSRPRLLASSSRSCAGRRTCRCARAPLPGSTSTGRSRPGPARCAGSSRRTCSSPAADAVSPRRSSPGPAGAGTAAGRRAGSTTAGRPGGGRSRAPRP